MIRFSLEKRYTCNDACSMFENVSRIVMYVLSNACACLFIHEEEKKSRGHETSFLFVEPNQLKISSYFTGKTEENIGKYFFFSYTFEKKCNN